MDSLIFSLNATIPIFLVMAAGYLLRRIGMLTKEFGDVVNKFSFKVTLPILLIVDLGEADFYEVWDTSFVLFCFVVTVVSIFSAYLLSMAVTRDRGLRGEFVQVCYRSSAAILGIAYVQNIYGDSGLVPLMMLGAVPLYNVMAVIVLSATSPEGGGVDGSGVKKSIKGIVTNPIILAIFAGILLSLLQIQLPTMVSKTLHSFASMASPMALLGLGVCFEGGKALAMVKPAVISAVVKLMVFPAVFLPAAVAMGYTGNALVAVLIMLGSPTTVSSYIMARNMGHEGVLTSSSIVLTTLFSSFSITFWLFILRTMGLV